MHSVEEAPRRHGTRLLVLWICWLLLAVFLIAAGVVSLR